MFLLLVAAWLRFHALAQEARFHPDEALFATFARNAAVQGDWLLHGALDKTPLTIYAAALSITLWGVTPLPNGVLTLDIRAGEVAARVPNVFASIVLVAVMYALAKRLYRNGTRHIVSLQGVPIVAALSMALSPFAIAFSATAFTDGLMLLFMMLSLWMAAAHRPLWAGVWLALGFACKQQAVFYLPLVLLVGWGMSVGTRYIVSLHMLRFLLPLACVIGILLVWDAARNQPVSVWALAAANNDPGRLIRSDEVLPRLTAWTQYATWFAGNGWMTAAVTILAGLAFVARLVRQPRRRDTLIDVLLVVYLLAYFLLHWLVAFNTYDRYLLPALPVALLLIARGIAWMTYGGIQHVVPRSCPVKSKPLTPLADLTPPPDLLPVNREGESPARPTPPLLAGEAGRGSKQATIPYLDGYGTRTIVSLRMFLLIVIFLCILAALDAANRRVPVGGDQGKHAGIDTLADDLDAKPLGTIIYDHWLGWELGYYMGAWSDKRRVYYPTPSALAADARLQPDPAPRYFPAPADQPIKPWLDALRSAGFAVSLVYDDSRFVVYELIPPHDGAGA